MKRNIISVALLAVLSAMAVSCQKENIIEPQIAIEEVSTVRIVSYTIDDIQIDNQSHVYISGRYSNHSGYPGVYLGTHQISNNAVFGESVYVAKLNNQGQFLWSKTPTSTMIPNTTTTGATIKGITFNGDQVIIAGAGQVENWGNGFNINMPYGHRMDPYLLFLNKQTGNAEGLTHVLGQFGR